MVFPYRIRVNRYIKHLIYTLEKSYATRVRSIILSLSWICIHQERYPRNACLFVISIDALFVRIISLGRVYIGKGKVEKCIGLYGKRVLYHILCFPFVSVFMRMHCPFSVPKSPEVKHHA